MKPSLAVLVAKRLADLIVGWIGTLVFVATYPFVALLIKIESRGPVLYSQQRIGINRRSSPYQIFKPKVTEETAAGGAGAFILSNRQVDYGGEVFTILKYRSMRIDAESMGPQLAKKGLDPRVTKIGKWLRALHIDELPQFVNILRGDMSLIGPRPERPYFTLQYAKQIPHYLDRTLWLKPGLTGLAQIILGYDDSLNSVIRKVHFDYAYRSATCNFWSWLKMEAWVALNTVLYLFIKPQFEGSENRDLQGLRRAKLLDFRALAPDKKDLDQKDLDLRNQVHRHETKRSLILVGSSPYELSRSLKDTAPDPKKTLEVQIHPDENFDLEDLGYMINLVHRVRQGGGRVAIKNSSPRVQKMLKEIHMDKVVDLHRPQDTVRNFMTVDVECWFHAYNLKEQVPPSTWHLQPTRVVANVRKILDLFRTHDTKATFFVLGWVADHFPDVVRMIDAEGHEIGTHGYYHNLLTNMTPNQFEEDLEKSLVAIGKRTKQTIIGHRASNFTIVESTLWALEILAKYGIEYDSSVFPIKRERYGISRYPNRLPHQLLFANGNRLTEIPMSTLGLGNNLIPISGGGYLRLYPYKITDRYIEQKNQRGFPAMVYFHPWELDTEQKRLNVGAVKGFQHYVNLDSTEWKLSRLMERFFFTSVKENLQSRRVQSLLKKNPVRIEKVLGMANNGEEVSFRLAPSSPGAMESAAASHPG